jgi:hypothetical protein
LAAFDAWVALQTPATILALDPALGAAVTAQGPGGNLTVHGNTILGDTVTNTTAISGAATVGGTLAVTGATTTHGINNSNTQITGVAAGVAPTDAANVGQVTTVATDLATEVTRATTAEGVLTTGLSNEVTRATAAEGVLTTGLANEVTNRGIAVANEATARAAADSGLQTSINTEVTRATNAEGVLTTGLANEVTNRTNAVTAEATARAAADTAEATARAAADTLIRHDFGVADTTLSNQITAEANTRAAEDAHLQSQINSSSRQIDRNTRGIAMVAAMTNTTIQAGMKQAIDFNLSQFDCQTGFAFGYGYKVNENLQINAAGGSTTDFNEGVFRLGLSYQW